MTTTPPETPEDQRIYIPQAAEQLDRRMGTLRKWETEGVLPAHLMPGRGKRGWRYWTADQIDGIRQWIEETDRRPGKNLEHYHPDEEQTRQQIHSMRVPRKTKKEES